MKIQSTELKRAMEVCRPATGSKYLPICDYLLVDSNVLIATNTDIVIQTLMDCENQERFLLPSKVLDTVKSLPPCPIEIEINEQLVIKAGRKEYKFKVADPSNFPEVSNKDFDTNLGTHSELQLAIKRAVDSSADSEIGRLSDICFRCDGDSLDVAGTDGHLLSVTSIKCDAKCDVSVPKYISKFQPSTNIVGIDLNSEFISLTSGNDSIMVKLSEKAFPNYAAVIPTGNEFYFEVDRLDLIASVRRLLIYSNEASQAIKFDIGEELTLSAKDNDHNREAKEILSISQNNHETICLNGAKLLSLLSNMDCDNVNITYQSPSKAILLNGEENFTALIMPIAI